jgi:hypothetical protein
MSESPTLAGHRERKLGLAPVGDVLSKGLVEPNRVFPSRQVCIPGLRGE